MPFTTKFNKRAHEGDSISCVVDGFTVTATIVKDDANKSPDKHSEGFWPSHDPNAAGYVLPEHYDAQMAIANRAMAKWKRGDLFYCGIVLSISRGGFVLDEHAASLWGIECNWPDSDNDYLVEVANELLPEALTVSKSIYAKIIAGD